MKHIYPIVNQRYINHKPTIYSSECNANMLMDLDEALGGRIIESCKDNIIIFKYCKENNYRMEGI
jgi:DNA replication protein DnaC